jgi:geranylgeranyl diphosphate synthase, type II
VTVQLIERRLNELTEYSKECLDSILFQAIRYALLGQGKRLRPQLVIASAEMFGSAINEALDPACAIEMVHTYSLIHDDLPSMDNDDMRRGRPTVHRAFSEGIAILAGDALLTEAFQILSKAPYLTSNQKVELIKTLALRAGKNGMVSGQAIDICGTKNLTFDQAFEMDCKKTGDLFACSLEFGAIIATAHEYIETLQSIGHLCGIAYQISDDFDDISEDKTTIVSILGKEKSQKLFQQTIQHLQELLINLPGRGKVIQSIFHFLG